MGRFDFRARISGFRGHTRAASVKISLNPHLSHSPSLPCRVRIGASLGPWRRTPLRTTPLLCSDSVGDASASGARGNGASSARSAVGWKPTTVTMHAAWPRTTTRRPGARSCPGNERCSGWRLRCPRDLESDPAQGAHRPVGGITGRGPGLAYLEQGGGGRYSSGERRRAGTRHRPLGAPARSAAGEANT